MSYFSRTNGTDNSDQISRFYTFQCNILKCWKLYFLSNKSYIVRRIVWLIARNNDVLSRLTSFHLAVILFTMTSTDDFCFSQYSTLFCSISSNSRKVWNLSDIRIVYSFILIEVIFTWIRLHDIINSAPSDMDWGEKCIIVVLNVLKRAIVTKTASAFNVFPVKINVTKQTNKIIREETKYIDKLIALRKQAIWTRSTSNLSNDYN